MARTKKTPIQPITAADLEQLRSVAARLEQLPGAAGDELARQLRAAFQARRTGGRRSFLEQAMHSLALLEVHARGGFQDPAPALDYLATALEQLARGVAEIRAAAATVPERRAA